MVALGGLARAGGVAALAVWVAGVGGLFGPVVNWTALTAGVALVGLGRLAGAD